MKLEFDEQTNQTNGRGRLLYAKFQKSSQPPSIVLFLIKTRIVKTEDSARILLLVITILIFTISIYMIAQSFNGPVFIDRVIK